MHSCTFPQIAAKPFFSCLAVALLLLCPAPAQAAPASLTYQGRILKTDGTPLEYNNVSFIFQVTDPSGACVIYQEQVNGYNMMNSNGVFDVSIGNGTITYPTSGSFTILDAFNNSGTFTCSGGSPYTASANDLRKLRVQFHDGIGWKFISPDSVVRSVPFAGYALSSQKLGNNVASDFLLKVGLPTCAPGTFLSWDGTTMACSAISGSAGGTVTSVSTGTGLSGGPITTSGTISLANTSVSAGSYGSATQVATFSVDAQGRLTSAANVTIAGVSPGGAASGDLSGNYPAPTVAALQGVPLSSVAPSSGQVLKYNGTSWAANSLTSSDISGLSATLSSYVTQSAFNGYVASASCSTSQTMYWNSVSGNFQCQSFNATLVGDVMGSTTASKVVALQNNPIAATLPSSGQVLQWNGVAWAPANISAGANAFTNGGNSFGSAATLGTNDTQTLGFKTDNATRMTIDTDGMVGIGTTTPGAFLDVVGNIRASTYIKSGITNQSQLSGDWGGLGEASMGAILSSTKASLTLLPSTQSGTAGDKVMLAYFSGASANSSLEVSNVSSGYSKLLLMKSGGNVGIGTTSPGQKLSVAGTVESTSGGFKFPDGTTQTTAATGGSGSQWTTSSSNIYYNSGNVGIGTANPSGLLAVNGRTDLGLGYTIANGTGAGGATNATNIWSPNLETTSSYDPETALRIARSSDHSSRFSSTFDVQVGSYAGSYQASTQVNFVLANGTTYTPEVNVMSLLANGKVGIGTTSPGQLLSVAGTVESTSGGFKFPDGTTQTTAAGAGSFLPLTGGNITGNLNASGSIGFGTTNPQSPFVIANGTNQQGIEIQPGSSYTRIFAYDRNASTYLPVVFDGNSKVGIGTTPSQMLSVGGIIQTTSGGFMFPDGTTQTTASNGKPTLPIKAGTDNFYNQGYDYLIQGSAGATPTGLISADTYNWGGLLKVGGGSNYVAPVYLTFFTSPPWSTSAGSGVERMRIDGSGNVGIGTQNPGQKLSVVGTVESTSGGFKFPDGTTQTTAATSSGASQWTTLGANISNSNTGNVGIGVSSPIARIHLSGGDGVGTYSNAALALGWSNTGQYAHFIHTRHNSGTNGNAIDFYTSDGTANGVYPTNAVQGLTILDGRVGVGTTAPGQKLTVTGTVESTSGGFKFPDGTTQTTAAAGGSSYLPLTGGTVAAIGVNGATGGASCSGQACYLNVAGNSNLNGIRISGADSQNTVLQQTSNTDMSFTANGGNIRFGQVNNPNDLYLSKTGNVGIGTTSPGRALQVGTAGGWQDSSGILLKGSNPGLEITDNQGTPQRWAIVNGVSINDGKLTFYNATSTSYPMTIQANGNVGIGTSSPSYTLHVVGTAGLSTGTAWTNASDIRLKDIQKDYEYGLNEVLQLHTVRYNYKKDNPLGLPSDFSKTGFIAQEVQKVIPDAVSTRKDGYLELNVDPIHWAVVNAIKDLYNKYISPMMENSKKQDREIAVLKEENERIKKQNEEILARLKTLENRSPASQK